MSLKEEIHIGAEGNSLSVREGKEVVVIEHGVKGLNPLKGEERKGIGMESRGYIK